MSTSPYPKMTGREIFNRYSRNTKLFSHPKWQGYAIEDELVKKGYAVYLPGCPVAIQWLTTPLKPHELAESLLQTGSIPHRTCPPLRFTRRLAATLATPTKRIAWGGFCAFLMADCVIAYYHVHHHVTRFLATN